MTDKQQADAQQQTDNLQNDNALADKQQVDGAESKSEGNLADSPEVGASEQSNLADNLHAQITALQNELKAARETAARANAEAYNIARRSEQEAEKSKKYALEKFAKALLDSVDNLERAIASAQNTDAPLLEGIQLTHKSLLHTLEKHGVVVIDPLDDDFNPEHHEAVSTDPDAPSGKVSAVLQKGYLLNDRLLRSAMVRVGQ